MLSWIGNVLNEFISLESSTRWNALGKGGNSQWSGYQGPGWDMAVHRGRLTAAVVVRLPDLSEVGDGLWEILWVYYRQI